MLMTGDERRVVIGSSRKERMNSPFIYIWLWKPVVGRTTRYCKLHKKVCSEARLKLGLESSLKTPQFEIF